MSASSDPTDLDVIAGIPCLAPLARRGWHLDRLPTTSVALSFAAAVLTTTLAFGVLASVPLILTTAVGLLLAASATIMKDVTATRITLQLTRVGLLAWVLLTAVHL
jgi:Mn2+/Fe2+ NRAMP family transporter